jgi:hypothetical protein
MPTARRVSLAGALIAAGWACFAAADPPAATGLRFEVTVGPGLVDAPRAGRLLVVLGKKKSPEPRASIGETGMNVPPLLGRDVKGLAPGVTATVDQAAATFPIANLGALPAGDYFVQAVLDANPDFKLPDAPGNLYSEPVAAKLDPARGGTVKLTLTRQVPPEQRPAETEYVQSVVLRSELLSRFHRRPYYLRAGVILPRDFARTRDVRFPLWVRIGGYGTRYTAVEDLMAEGSPFRDAWLADGAPRMVLLHLDGAGPYGDPYQVNSANNGPYGDAVTRELIPYVEKRYRCVGRPYARVLDGHSTGGWVSLALQVFYPDFFNGAWSHAPDPVDFRAFELIDVYRDANAYVNRFGFERPSERTVAGDVKTTVRHEVQLERVLGRGDRWELSGKDWGAWNATFGPRGDDGLPRPLWDGVSGRIDRTVLEHWKKYDLRLVLQKDWPTLGPKLRGKLRVWVGEADDYFLNNAVHLLDDFLAKAKPAYGGKITFGPRQGHGWRGLSDKQMLEEMAAAVERGRKEAEGR